jgi:peptidoglycan/xylan/chitin deacetylase (PgdA/CDA1 family)
VEAGAAPSVGSRARRIALTIDVEHPDQPGSRPGATERLLDLLGRAGVRATFFVQGRWAEAFPATARRIATEGHLVGSHSFYHARLTLLSDEGVAADISRADAVVREATGVDPRPWFRCPFGDGSDDPRVLGAIGRLGYVHVGWDVDAVDWDPDRTATQVAETIRTEASARPTSVVLLHGWPPATRRAVASTIRVFSREGAAFVTIDELGAAELPAGMPAELPAEAASLA